MSRFKNWKTFFLSPLPLLCPQHWWDWMELALMLNDNMETRLWGSNPSKDLYVFAIGAAMLTARREMEPHAWLTLLWWWFTFKANSWTSAAAPRSLISLQRATHCEGEVLITTICVTLRRTLLWCNGAKRLSGRCGAERSGIFSSFSGFCPWEWSQSGYLEPIMWIKKPWPYFGLDSWFKAAVLRAATESLVIGCRQLGWSPPFHVAFPSTVCMIPFPICYGQQQHPSLKLSQ